MLRSHNFACLFVCLYNKRQNGLTDRAQIFSIGSSVTQGRFMDGRIFKNLLLKKFNFYKFEKFKRFFLNPRNFWFIFVLQ